MPDDAQLLRCYAEEKSEAAFAALVRRYLDLVYSAALRQVGGDAHRAHDVTQIVFTTLARKAPALTGHPVLAGWLYTATQHAAAKAMRTEWRRQVREQEAHAMQEIFSPTAPEVDWARVRPVLDRAMGELNDRDREAILLRFFAQRPFAEIGSALELSEDAARMRVERALAKLHGLLARRGVTSTAAALGAVLANQAVVAAPAGLLASVTSTAFTGTAAAEALGFLNFMSTTKLVIAGASLIALLAIGTGLFEAKRAGAFATALETTQRERDSLRTSLARAEKTARQSDENLGTLQKELDDLHARVATAPIPPKPAALPDARALSAMTASPLEYVLEHPEKRSAYIEQEVLRAKARFDRFFRQTQLTPEQQDQFVKNLREFAEQKLDFMGAIRTYGYNPDNLPADSGSVAQMGRLEKQIPIDLQTNMRTLLGDAGFQQYQQYTRTLPLHNTIDEVASRLYDTAAPLTAAQAEQLTQIMRQTPFRTPIPGFQGNTAAGTFVSVGTYNGAKTQLNLQGGSTLTDWHEPVSDAAVAQAAAVLSPAQLAALRQVQEQQIAQLLAAPSGPDVPKPGPGLAPVAGK